jgi:small subunit ribosomal protein S18
MKVKTKSTTRGGRAGSKTGGRAGGRAGAGGRTSFKKRDTLGMMRKKYCKLCADKIKSIDYKDSKRLESFIRDRGKMVSSRLSGTCAKHQRRVAEAVKKARFISLLPYVR